MKKKILLCALSFFAVALFATGIFFIPFSFDDKSKAVDYRVEGVVNPGSYRTSASSSYYSPITIKFNVGYGGSSVYYEMVEYTISKGNTTSASNDGIFNFSGSRSSGLIDYDNLVFSIYISAKDSHVTIKEVCVYCVAGTIHNIWNSSVDPGLLNTGKIRINRDSWGNGLGPTFGLIFAVNLRYRYYINGSKEIFVNESSEQVSRETTVQTSSYAKAGYTLEGFYSGQNKSGMKVLDANGYLSSSPYTPGGAIYPGYTANNYTLTVNPNGGSWKGSTATQNVTQGCDSTLTVANPTRTGYTFTGWTLSGAGSISGTTYKFGPGNATITANWKKVSSTLTVNPNGGSYSGSTSITKEYGSTQAISSPSRTGYTLGAWVLDGGGSISTFGKLHDSYTDPFFMDGTNSTQVYNNSGNGTVTHEYIASSNAGIKLPTGARILRIKNAGTSSPGLGGFTNHLQSYANAVFYTIIYAKIPKGYSIQLGSNSTGTNPNRPWLTSQAGTGDWQIYIKKIQCGSSGDFSTTNYYYINGGANGTASNPVTWEVAYFGTYDATGLSASGSSTGSLTYTYDDSNNSLVALWNINSYTLTVNPNGGTWNGSSSSQSFTQNYNTTKAIANPVRYGYIFDKWTLSGSGSISGTTFTFGAGNTTLTAQWIETWAVNYTVPSGKGTEEDPYQVDSASDLAYFAYKTQILGEQCYDHIVLTRDIDLAGYDWMPIGTGRNVVSGVQAYFRGVFDGQGHTISNLNINVEGEQELNEYGLFGLIDVDAVLKNFTITSGEVNGNERVGGVVGWVWSASVENVTNYANVNGSKSVGGIIGKYHSWEDDFVRECQNYGTITGTNYTAGIVGGGDDSSGMQNIVDCVNYGTIKGASFTGGIVGNIVKVKMSGCVNYGSISGQDRVGGIAGRVNNNSVVSELVNYGDVTGWTHVAGILGGAAYADSATSCFNLGNIKGESHIGGVIGYLYDGITLTNSANFGNITGTNTEVGGLIGLVESSSAGAVIRNNGSEGSLVGTGATNVGGLIGRAGGTNVIENNYANMTTTNNTFIGAGSVNGAYIYVLNVNGTTYKRYHGSVTGFVWVSGSPCPIPKDFSWVGGNMSSVTTSSLTSNGFTAI